MYLEKIKKDNANNALLAASKTKNTNLPAPLAPPRGQVEEPPKEVDCCVKLLKQFIKNHNQRRPNRRAKRRKMKQADRSPDQVAAAAEATHINNSNREQRITNTQIQETTITTTRRQAKKITNRVNPPITRARSRVLAKERALQVLAHKEKRAQQRRAVRLERTQGYNEQFQGCGYNKKLTKEQLRVAVLDGLIPYAVADSGCTTTCVKP